MVYRYYISLVVITLNVFFWNYARFQFRYDHIERYFVKPG